MLLRITFDERDVVDKAEGRIVLKCSYYAEFATVLNAVTTKGATIEDFEKNDALKSKNVFVGQKGGIFIT